jgi:hypothetical protein
MLLRLMREEGWRMETRIRVSAVPRGRVTHALALRNCIPGIIQVERILMAYFRHAEVWGAADGTCFACKIPSVWTVLIEPRYSLVVEVPSQ